VAKKIKVCYRVCTYFHRNQSRSYRESSATGDHLPSDKVNMPCPSTRFT